MSDVNFATAAQGRQHFKDLLDAAEEGLPNTVHRDHLTAVVVESDRLRQALIAACPARAEVVAEAEGWSVFLPGLPIAADGSTFEEAIDEMVVALREYAADWADHLRTATNHRGNWALVQLISLSTDGELKNWLTEQAS